MVSREGIQPCARLKHIMNQLAELFPVQDSAVSDDGAVLFKALLGKAFFNISL